MNKKILIFSSVTYALRAMTLLGNHSISCHLEKLKSISALGGCGYGLALDAENVDAAISIISSKGIKIIDVLDDI